MTAHPFPPTDRPPSGPWMQMAHGNVWDFFSGGPIDWSEMAHALGNLCRFTGHCHPFFSVAEHLCRAAEIVAPEHRLATLLHDGHEYIVGDPNAPMRAALKAMDQAAGLDRLAEIADFHIHRAAGLPWPLDPDTRAAIRHADLVMLATEKRDLMVPPRRAWDPLPDPLPMAIKPWPPATAATRWLGRLRDWLPPDGE